MQKIIKILFLGQKIIAEDCFRILLKNNGKRYHITGVCSNIEKLWWGTNDIYKKSIQYNIPFIPNNKRNEEKILSLIKSNNIDIIISVQHPWILSNDILKSVNYRAFNLHNAKLPSYKGFYTINHAILNGEKTYTSTIHWMIEEVDCGNIAFEETIPISKNETAISLYEKSCKAGLRVFKRLINYISTQRKIPSIKIKGKGHFYKKGDLNRIREIKNPQNSDELNRKARALFFPPFEPAYYKSGTKKIYVLPKNYKKYIKNLYAFLNRFKKRI